MPKKHNLPIWAYEQTLTLVPLLNKAIAEMEAVSNSGHIPAEDRNHANRATGLATAALELVKNLNSHNEDLSGNGNGQAAPKVS